MTEIVKPTGREVRVAVDTWPTADLEIRAAGDGMTFTGYAAVFNSWSEDMFGFREKIEPGAFARSLKRDRNLRMFLNHNSDNVLATTKAGTLSLAEDDKGLRVEAQLPDTQAGRDLSTLMKRGDVDSMSFGFQAIRDKWSEDLTERTLLEVRLFEVSPVTGWPAYPATSATVRHLAELVDEEVEPLEAAFRVLADENGRLTIEQRDLLLRVINVRTDAPLVAPTLASYRALFEARKATIQPE
jgi:HK97 family phage prohead protease